MPNPRKDPEETGAARSLLERGERFDVLGSEAGLELGHLLGRFAHDQMGLHRQVAEHVKQPDAINGA
jgi:hypothetical protein